MARYGIMIRIMQFYVKRRHILHTALEIFIKNG